MREIKFRAWDESLRLFHFWDSSQQLYDNVFWSLAKAESMLIEQYTGLNDKNGKEIYEGDILAFERIKDFKKEYVFPKEIKWENRGDSGVTGWTQFAPLDSVVVIGNTHQNPELLNQ